MSALGRSVSIAIALAALASGCCCAGPPGPRRIGPSPVDAAMPFFPTPDAGPTFRDVGVDATHVDDPLCSMTGSPGFACREGVCRTGASCASAPPDESVQAAFGLRPGVRAEGDAYATVATDVDPAWLVPFLPLAGGLCVEACDLGGADTCCGTCAQRLTQMPLLASLGGARNVVPAPEPFGPDTGICRIDCEFDPSDRGSECSPTQACDPHDGTCVEACVSDAACATTLGITYDGELVTLLDETRPVTCETSTGRCVFEGDASAELGDPCTSDGDCAPGIGLCIDGACAESGCGSLSCAGHGVCTGIGGAPCLPGCDTAEDCGALLACRPVDGSVWIGRCVGDCDSSRDCRIHEACFVGRDGRGACVPTCTEIGVRGAAAGCGERESCVISGPGERACAALDGFCDVFDASVGPASRDCGGGQICDALLARGAPAGFARTVVGDGHCVDACVTDGDCARAGTTCQTSGVLAGLCRRPCVDDAACTDDGTLHDTACDLDLGVCAEP